MKSEVNKLEVILARHLHDRDELLSHGFDNELMSGQEEKSEITAEKILEHCREFGLGNVMIFSSTKLRALETAQQIERALTGNTEGIEIELKPETALRELDQGKVNLPEDFKDGDYFPQLREAWDIFFKESFDNNNLLYHFGDPLVAVDGQAKYEQLRGVFSVYGECYAQFAVRIYDFLVKLGNILKQAKVKFDPVLVIHSASFSVIRDLSFIGKEVERSTDQLIPFGTLVKRGWDEYHKNKATRRDPDFGESDVVDVTSLLLPEILDQVSIESDLLKIALVEARDK